MQPTITPLQEDTTIIELQIQPEALEQPEQPLGEGVVEEEE